MDIDIALTFIFIVTFRPIAVGALLTTVAACTLIVVQSMLDLSATTEEMVYPQPTIEGTFKAFGSVMFAFAGASTFPTIQADMRQREKFNISAVAACIGNLTQYSSLFS